MYEKKINWIATWCYLCGSEHKEAKMLNKLLNICVIMQRFNDV